MTDTDINKVKCPAVKRLLREAAEMQQGHGEQDQQWSAAPLEDNLFEWHFTIRGAADTEYEGGLYHGRILLPPHYPMRPPHIILMTPTGRFEVNKKICLSISGHHPETWQPSWSIRTALLALVAFMSTPAEGAVGSLDYTVPERKALATKSRSFKCPTCGPVTDLISGSAPVAVPCLKQPEVRPVPVPPSVSSDRDGLDNVRDVLIFFLMIAIAIFFYRRIDTFQSVLSS